jgi:hypothetical protein
MSSEEEGIVANEFCAASKTMKTGEATSGRHIQGKETAMVGLMG